jgi:hypothetical protein
VLIARMAVKLVILTALSMWFPCWLTLDFSGYIDPFECVIEKLARQQEEYSLTHPTVANPKEAGGKTWHG